MPDAADTGADGGRGTLPRRAVAAAPLVGIVTLAITAAVALSVDLPIRDPDGGVLGSPLIMITVVTLVFIGIDVVPRGLLRAGWPPRGLMTALADVRRERWGVRRLMIVIGALIGFYLTYVGYRNLKSFVPFARHANFDQQLHDLDRDLTFGGDPGTFLHDLLGTGAAAHVLAFVYVMFLVFVPISLGVAVVWQRRLHRGLWYVTTMNFAWLLGVASYYALPSLGPVFTSPERYSLLPATSVSALQQSLLEHRSEIMAAPHAADGVQSIAAFASLHIAIVLSAALIAHLLGLPRFVRVTLWTFLGLTFLATIYFGWHYIVDDIAGAAIGFAAVVLGALATGHSMRSRAARAPLRAPLPAAAVQFATRRGG
jgi:hypothetical protein